MGVLLTAKNLEKKFIIGETTDGGFYFFGGSIALPSSLWLSVEYSTNHTAFQLTKNLALHGEVELIKKSFDVDTLEDLRRLSRIAQEKVNLLPEQISLISWAGNFR